jgi:prepilin-type N-terminal cleavage/methylation domain-containing protein
VSPVRRGFTLFEVMAAVLVLGVIFGVLAEVAIEGLRAEGSSRRRLEASLLADELLNDLEGELLAGAFPEVGSSEREVGDFRVTVEVEPFDPSPYLALASGGDETSDSRRDRGDEALSLLAPPGAGESSLIRSFEVAVHWSEGFDEHQVRRTTFAYDAAAIAPYVEGAAGTGSGAGSADTDESGADGDTSGSGSSSGSSGGGGSLDAKQEAIRRMLEQLRNAR